jgi:hypothetical protein
MRFASEPRCPSTQCLKSFGREGPIPLLAVLAQPTPRPEWFEKIVRYKETHSEHLVDAVYECPYCRLVWTQPNNFAPGFRAVRWGFRRENPERLEPIPPSVRMKDPEGHMVAEGKGKRRR